MQGLLKTDSPMGRARGKWYYYKGIPTDRHVPPVLLCFADPTPSAKCGKIFKCS